MAPGSPFLAYSSSLCQTKTNKLINRKLVQQLCLENLLFLCTIISMDNHSFPDDIHVYIAQDTDNDTNAQDVPELVPLDARESQSQQQTTTGVEISGEGLNILPIASLSDSLYQDYDSPDSESGRDAHEVEMQTVNNRSLSDHAIPNSTPTSHTVLDHPAVNNRRARVDDDEDEDRDRRHPSQRIGNSANAASSAGPSSSAPPSFPQLPTPPPQATLGARFRGQAPIFTRTVVDEPTTGPRTHPFRFFQHLMSNNNNNDNNDAGNVNPVPSSGTPAAPAPPHQDGNAQDNHPHARIETFSVTLDIGVGPAFTMGGGGPQPHEGQATANAADPNLNANPNDPQNPNIQGISIADFMARLGQAIGIGDNGAEGANAAPTADNPAQGPGAAGANPGAQFGFNIPGGFNLANLAGLGFGFNFDGSGFGEKEDPDRARKLVDGLEEVPVGLVRRLERVGGTGGGMGEDETKGGDGGCAICWDRLLGSVEEVVHEHQECEKKEEENEGTQPETPMSTDQAWNRTTTKIVSLPCAHVFHADCLIPWFSRPRQTTCPTCRFNIDPENLTYVSWRRRMRERRERERAEARARNPENADGNEADQDGNAQPTAAAEPAVAPLPDAALFPEQVLNFLTRPFGPVRPQTPDAFSVPNDRHTPVARSSSQPPAASSSSLLSDPAPSTPQASSRTNAEEEEIDWDTMPGLQDATNSDDEDDDSDEDEDEDEEDGDEAQEEEHGIQAPPVLPQANEPPSTTPPVAQAQGQAPRPRQNDPLAPRTIQTAHGMITFIPVPFNFPFPAAGNGVGVGVQAGGNGNYSHSFFELPQFDPVLIAATANPQVPPVFGQGQGQHPNGNANINVQGEYMRLITPPDTHILQFLPPFHLSHFPAMYLSPFLPTLLSALPQGFPIGLGFPNFHIPMPPMPEFGAQRGVPAPAPAPAPANTATNNVNANLNQAIPTSPFVNAQEAAAITHTEEHLMQHLRSQGLNTDDAENIRRSSLAGRQADRLRRGENPADAHLDMVDEDEDDMMDIDEGMGMVVDLTMNQVGMDGGEGAETGPDAPGMMGHDDRDRRDFDNVMNFFNNAARQAQRQAQAGTQTQQGQAPQPERGTQEGTPPNDQNGSQQPPQQPPPPQPQQPQPQQGQGFFPPNFGNFNLEDDRTINDFVTRMFANLGGPHHHHQQQQAPQQAPQAQGQNDQPPPQAQGQPQPQAGQEPAAPNPANTNANANNNNNGGRPRQQAQFAFSNVTFGPFTNFGSLFGQVPMNPGGTANTNGPGTGQERVKKAWTLPPAPGPTLRQRIERRERDAGLRCYDISCGVGPSDEDPIVSDETIATGLRQLMIMSKNHGVDGMPGVCVHTFHPGCLVSAERVALGGADVNVIEGGDVEVSCPVCRSAGCVTKQEWEEGILALS